MNRVTFPPATADVSGTNQHAGPAGCSGGRASGVYFPGKSCARLLALFLGMAGLLGGWSAMATGTWVPLNNQPPGGVGIDTMLLLPDGTVMGAEGVDPAGNIGTNWWRLTPDITGSYVNGTWSQRASMHDSRLYFSSEVLPNGTVLIAGGEYGSGFATSELYDPVHDTWTEIPIPAGLLNTNNTSVLGTENDAGFMDSGSEILPNGDVIVVPVVPFKNGGTMIYSFAGHSWSAGPNLVRGFDEDESTLVKLPDDSILLVDFMSTNSERYIPSLNQWVNDANVPVPIYDTNLEEMGPGFLLPNGNAFILGNVGKTAIYTPSGAVTPGVWAAGANEPANLGLPDSPGAMMVNGKILVAFAPTQTNFQAPTTFYEYDPVANAFTQAPTTPDGGNYPSFLGRMLDLPDGTVLYASSQSQLYVYVPDNGPLPSAKPVISSIVPNPDGSYLLTGTQLNGISQGASYGDDAQMNSNYPLIRMTDSHGHVFYARSFNWSSTGVMTGSKPVTTEFVLNGIPGGVYSLVAVANGISSDAVQFVANAPDLILFTNILSGGNGNGMIDPDECNNLNVLVTNQGNAAATGVQGILISLTPGVIIGQSVSAYPNLPPLSSGLNQTPFTISTEPSFVCGTTVNLELVLKSDQTVTTNLIQFATGALGPPVRFNNPTPMTFTAGALSPMLVSGINTVGKVTVSVYLSDAEDEFMELELISPNGTTSFLALSDGGTGANFGSACSPEGLRTTFDDAATQSILSGNAPLTGSYIPETPLSVFNLMTGTNANGIWELSLVNELGTSTVLNCWSLSISPELCADGGGQCPGADLSLTMTAAPSPTSVGGPVVYTLSVSNAGPSPASNTVVSQTLPSSMVYQGAVSSQGTVSQLGPILTFSLGTLGIQSTATITVDTVATTPGFFTSTGNVGSPASDPNPNNNTASASVLVTKPSADLAVAMSVAPSSVPVNGQATFVIGVTNNGPATALGVVLTNFLPANVNVVSASTSQGSVAPGGTLVFVGTLAPGAGAAATLVISPTVVGTSTLTSKSGIDPSETDPLTGNNTASASISVVPAADLGVSVVVSPSPAVSGANFAYVVTITNAGPATATNVVMNQTLPSGITFVSTSQSSAVDNNGVVTWTINSNLPSGASVVLTNIVRAPTLLLGVASNVLVSTSSVFGQPGDPHTNNNFLSVSTIDLRPMAVITALGATLTSESFQPANGAVDPGETVGVQFQLQNMGNIPTTNLVATLQTNGGVIPVSGQGQATYGALAAGGGTGIGQFQFSNSGTNGGMVVATLQLQDGPTNLGTVSFTFIMPVISTFWRNELISIPATNFLPNPASGPASPYPSSNLVFGVTNYVSGVTVTVSNLQHTFPHDISMLLVGPGGGSSVLMSGAAAQSSATIPLTITFDQNASAPLPATGSLVSGSYQPAEYNSPIFTNVPNIVPPYNTNLSVFAGVPPNGRWNLYVYDGSTGDFGAISNGWGLTFSSITPVNQITDLGVTIAASTNQITEGGAVTYTITVTNSGTNGATVLLTNVLGAGLTFVSNTTGAYVPYQQIGQTQYYNLGLLAGQTNLTLGFVANTTGIGAQTSTVNIGSSLIDPNVNNNTASAAVAVVLPAADVSAAISASTGSNPVVEGTNVIYTLTVTNNGPGLALDVTGSLTQGITGASGVVFSNNFGNIAAGTIATALFTNAPASTNSLTNTWTVSTGSSDSNLANNIATDVLTVTYAEPVIVTNGVRLLSESFVPVNGAIDAKETVTVAFILKNTGAAPTTNLTATLQATGGVIPITTSQNYGVVLPGASVARNFTFGNSGLAGSALTAMLVNSDNGYALGSVSVSFTISTSFAYTNTAAITIPDQGPATPYPSGIAVSGASGVIGKATATLQGFTHSFPQDVNVLVTSPSGQQTVLMGHQGGSLSVTNLTLTFDDAATNSLSGARLVSGTNHPGEILPLTSFIAISGRPSNTNLSIFNGSNPNGLWSLYVFDDTAGNNGSIAGGWTLDLTLVNPVNASGSLAVGMSHTPDPVFTGNPLAYTITVTNLGPGSATNVVLTDTLPAGVILSAASASQGTVDTSVSGTVAFNLGTIVNVGDVATATIQVQPQSGGSITNSATATDATAVPWPGATASDTANVLASPGRLAVGMTSTPNPVLVFNFLTYRITVTNLGPGGATNVFLTDTLPSSVNLDTATASQGTVNTSVAGTVTFSLGTITNIGDTATATIQVQPQQASLIVNSATATNATAVNSAGATVASTNIVIDVSNFRLAAALSSNNVILTLSTLPVQTGQNYVIQVSTNLITWANLSTNNAVSAGQFVITNSTTNFPAQFYRAVHQPQ